MQTMKEMLDGFHYAGIWQMEGNGLLFEIRFGKVTTYEITESYYYKEKEYGGFILGNTLISGLGKLELRLKADTLEIIDSSAQNSYTARRITNEDFSKRKEVEKGMQSEKFQMFYEMLNENYGFQKHYGVDLTATYQELKPLIDNKTSDEALYEVMKKLVAGLQDGHVRVSWKDETYCPLDYMPDWITDNSKLDLVSQVIIEKYIKGYKKLEDCPIRYGYLSDDIGVIVIHGMGTESLDKSKSTRESMDRIIQEFNAGGIKKIALELRFNGGGFDETSLCIAAYFL